MNEQLPTRAIQGTYGTSLPFEQPRLDQPTGFDLRDLIGVVQRQIAVMIATTIGLLLLAALVIWQLAPAYTATSLVVVDSRESQLLGLDATGQVGMAPATSTVETEAEIARSLNVVERVVERLDLARGVSSQADRGFAGRIQDAIDRIRGKPAPEVTAETLAAGDQRARALAVAQVSSRMAVRRRGLTNIISISFTDGSPQRAADVANGLAESYIDEQVSAKESVTINATRNLQVRVDRLAETIRRLDSEVESYVTDQIDKVASPEARQRLMQLRSDLSLADRTRSDSQNDIDALRAFAAAGSTADLPERLMTPELQDLAERRRQVQAQLAQASLTDEQRLAQARRELNSIEAEITRSTEARETEAREALQVADQRRQSLQTELQATITNTPLPPDVTVGLYKLQREAQTNRDLYEATLARLRRLEQQTDMNISDARIVARAAVPTEPSFPPTNLLLLASLLGALGAGFGLALLRDHFIGGFTSVNQLEQRSSTSVVSVVPFHEQKDHPDASNIAQVIARYPLSSFAESMRRTRIGIEATLGFPRKATYVVTSTESGEGKTTMAIALAQTFALSGKKTLLIDGDLRRPSVAKAFDQAVEIGLFDFLAAKTEGATQQFVTRRVGSDNLDIIFGSSGSLIATDSFFAADRFASLLSYARERYDVIVIDSPPIGLVVDARVIAQHADAVLYVVRWAATNQVDVVSGVREMLSVPTAKVMTTINQSRDRSRYGYRYRYSYYYRGGKAGKSRD